MLATVLSVLTAIAGTTTEASVIAQIINALTQIIPLLISEYKALVTPVKNIIAALSANAATTAEQLTTLQALDTQADVAFEGAAAAAQAEDATSST
jgi:hypothetical protein